MTEFETVYRRYFKDVFLYLKGLSGDEHLVEDLASEAFLKAMKAIDHFKGTCDVRVWLCQIAKNCYFSYLRKNRETTGLEALEEQPGSQHVENTVCSAERQMELHEIIHSLPEPYKEVFTLRVFGELSFRQIGKIFNKTENWACVTYHRSRKKIKERMEQK